MHSLTRQGPPPTLGTLGNLRFTQAYPKELESVPRLRARFRHAASYGNLDDDLLSRGEMCLSELAGNAVRHAMDPRKRPMFLAEATIRVMRRRHLHLEVSVWDIDKFHVPTMPDPATAALQLFGMDDATGGRGLLLASTLSEEFGCDVGPHGKRVWCRWAV